MAGMFFAYFLKCLVRHELSPTAQADSLHCPSLFKVRLIKGKEEGCDHGSSDRQGH